MAQPKQTDRMEQLVSLCKRRGFIFPSSEIYGGINGFWDYGPVGVLLKRNVKEAWWHDMVTDPPPGPDGRPIEMVGLDCSIIMNPKVWEASGHVKGFTDPMMDCRECKARFRADHLYRWHLAAEDGTEILGGFLEANSVSEIEGVLEGEVKRAARQQNIPELKKVPRIQQYMVAFSTRGEDSPHATFLVEGGGQAFSGQVVQCVRFVDFATAKAGCPNCGAIGSFTEPRKFNMMFKTFVGASEDSSSAAYLRPETAQGIFANFKNVCDTSRVKVPFGIAQIGKAFRNEINPRNYTFRSREFEQMEIEFFCPPADGMTWYEFWRDQRINWYKSLGLRSDHLRPREQGADELAHYSQACTDIEYLFPFSDEPQELEGVAHRGDFDLSQHQKFSGKDLTYFDEAAKQRYLPHVIEPSAGADRFTLAVLCEAFCEDQAPDEKGAMQTRTVMRFHPRLAPFKVAVFPLVRKDGMPEIADKLYRQLKRRWAADYDEKSAVGRRYRRHDEIGTPFCVTVDGQTKEDDTVTVRDRDSMEQVRVKLDGVESWLADRLAPARA